MRTGRSLERKGAERVSEIWADRLLAGTRAWEDAPEFRRRGIEEALRRRVESGEATAARVDEIIGGKRVG